MAAKRGNPAQDNTGSVMNDRFTGYGMIQPGVNGDKYEQPTPLDRIGAFINKHFGTKHTPKPMPKSGGGNPPPMTTAQEDSLSKRYLGK